MFVRVTIEGPKLKYLGSDHVLVVIKN